MRRKAVCVCAAIISMLFLAFWIVAFIALPTFPQTGIETIKVVGYINIGFVVVLLCIFAFAYKLTLDKVMDDSVKSNPKWDSIFYKGICFVFVGFLAFEMIAAFCCNIQTLELTVVQNIQIFHIPWLVFANCAMCFACYVVYQYFRHSIKKQGNESKAE